MTEGTSPLTTMQSLPQTRQWIGGEGSSLRGVIRFLGILVKRKPLGAFGGAVILIVLGLTVFAEVIAPYPPNDMHISDAMRPPSLSYIFGTDIYGRDVFSRLLHGGRVSLYIGLATVILSSAAATLLGTISGYVWGTFDLIFQRFVDAVLAIPRLVFLLAIMSILGPGITNMIMALTIRSTAASIRTVRSAVLTVKEKQYMEAARAVGCSHLRMVRRHVIPNIIAPIIVISSINMGTAILSESAVSFLGFGVPPPTATWGSMMSGQNLQGLVLAPWVVFFPGITLSLAVFGVNVLGDALRDLLDPRLRVSRFQ